jgi:hypothetical protein
MPTGSLTKHAVLSCWKTKFEFIPTSTNLRASKFNLVYFLTQHS